MPAFVALLRAVNVGGRAPLAMDRLRAIAGEVGFRAPRTLLQSGNLVFEAELANPAELGARLEAALAASVGLETSIFVRSAAQWAGLVDELPFAEIARDDPSHLVAMPLAAAPADDRCAALRAAIVGREQVAVLGTTAYIAYPDGIGRSKLTAALIERLLGTRGTGRNWRTVSKIAAALGG